MTALTPTDAMIAPAEGTAGFLAAAPDRRRKTHPSVLTDAVQQASFNQSTSASTTSTALRRSKHE